MNQMIISIFIVSTSKYLIKGLFFKELNISKKLHVIFDGKVLRPEEPVDLKPNAHYIVTIEHEKKIAEQNLWDVLEDLTGKVEGPEDWSQEHDHYLYGTPKRGKG